MGNRPSQRPSERGLFGGMRAGEGLAVRLGALGAGRVAGKRKLVSAAVGTTVPLYSGVSCGGVDVDCLEKLTSTGARRLIKSTCLDLRELQRCFLCVMAEGSIQHPFRMEGTGSRTSR